MFTYTCIHFAMTLGSYFGFWFPFYCSVFCDDFNGLVYILVYLYIFGGRETGAPQMETLIHGLKRKRQNSEK